MTTKNNLFVVHITTEAKEGFTKKRKRDIMDGISSFLEGPEDFCERGK